MANYIKQTSPFVVPTTDGKVIEEHYGRASNRQDGHSVAHMVAPPQWGEPFQKPDFDEVTIVVAGQMRVEVDGDTVELTAGESIQVGRGCRVRYSNPYDAKCEYWAICVPAFSPDTVHRED